MDTKSQDGLNGSPGKVPQRKRTLSRKLSNIKLISYKKPKNKKFSLFKLKNPKFTKLKLSLEKLKNFKVKPKLLLQYRFACVVLLFALSALFIAAGINPTTSVIFNGELVGVVESPEIVREALKAAEAKASEILGYKYCISEASPTGGA